jgi:hypothetical protein
MYRLSPVEQAEVKSKLTDLLEKGLVEPRTSPYGAPILLARRMVLCVWFRIIVT